MTLTIMAFGAAKDIMGGPSVVIESTAITTVGQLREELERQYPALKSLASFAMAVNGTYADKSDAIRPRDEIAVIPPVSGG